MNEIQKIFKRKKAFIAYLTAGHRGLDTTKQAAIALFESGVDILELGVPFSDPIADGPVIQDAMQDALERGITLLDVLSLAKDLKQTVNKPIVLFSYCNPLMCSNNEVIIKEIKQSGIDALLIVDLPIEESENFHKNCQCEALSPIPVIAPTSSTDRIQQLQQNCNAFLYYVCRKGTTGMKKSLPDDFPEKIKTIKESTEQPVVAGFGIADKHTAKQVLAHADGFVVGSAFVNAITKGASPTDLRNLTLTIDPR